MSSDNPGENHNYGIMLENAILTAGQAIEVYYEPSTGFGNAVAASWVTSLSLGQWYHVVGVHDAGADTLTLFVNSVQRAQNTGATATPDTGNAPLRIADVNVDIFPNEFNGQIDEVRVSNTVRSANWIQTEYNNQNDPESFYSIGRECSVSGHPPNAHYFTYYKEIIIDHTMVSGPDDLLNFPLLISCFDEDLHDKVQVDGDDIAFSDSTSWFDHEIELFNQTYNSTHAQLAAWVRIPRLSTSVDTVIRMYYGNSTMESRENPEEVWDDNYEFVLHMNQDPSSSDILDSTSNGFDFDVEVSGSMTSSDLVNGQTGKALAFDGLDDYIYLPVSEGFSGPTDKMTFEFWLMFPDGWSPASRVYLGAPATFDAKPRLAFYNTFEWLIETTSDTRTLDSTTTNFNAGTWYHFSTVWDGTGGGLQRIYISGSLESNDPSPRTGDHISWNTFSIGAEDADANGPGGSGSDSEIKATLSEFRVSNVVRSADWIATEYENQNDPTSFHLIGKEYTLSGIPPNEHYFKYYKEVIIDHTKVSGSHDLINFPLLISTFDEDLHDKAQMDGDDIALAYNGAWLDHEIELFNQTYNSSYAQLITWVSIPRLSPSEDTIIRMYYGNSTMGTREKSEGVWDSNYKGVWHLSENPTGTILDSTSYDNDGTAYNMESEDQKMGQIDGSLDFDGNNEYINIPYYNLSGSITYSLWFKREGSGDQDVLSYMRTLIRLTDTEIKFWSDLSHGATNIGWSPDTNWHHLAIIQWDTNVRILLDGSVIQSTGAAWAIDTSNAANRIARSPSTNCFDGWVDEVRISDANRSGDWIVTAYNNQYNPQSFLTVSSEESFDLTPPTYSNLVESLDPLELGETEVIEINVTDPSGINQVKIEFEGSNHSMTNIGGKTWQYNSWIPNSVGNYTYTIWMEDNYHNWNSTSGSIEVLDTTAPTYSDLIESADPLQVGQNETISIKVYDTPGSGVNQVLLEYESSNHTMTFIGSNTWSWDKWNASVGVHPYTIFMEDMENNWNMTSGTITVVSTSAPVLENHTKSADPLELGNNITITIDVYDNEGPVEVVLIELEGLNHTMYNISGVTYGFNWTGSYVGFISYTIYANDTENNWNSYSSGFDIVDTTPPTFSDLFKSEDPLEFRDIVIITVNSTDLSDINQAIIEFEGSNHSMSNIGGNSWQYDLWSPSAIGNHTYTIWAEDNNNNWGFINDTILVRDSILPLYSDLTESANPVEFGDPLIISINCTDLASIKDVVIEYENSNHTMTNIGGDLWQYISWMPNSIGNYTYTIYIRDNNDNLNYVSSSILFQDTIIPVYSNFFESADPLELGGNPIIRIETYDFAGINQVSIEFEGANHSMTNIYGNTWQYDSWTPNNWILYQYTIHMEDMSGNWNSMITNITVQDTIPPPNPLFAVNPSGDVSGILDFDWMDGSDPSGISYYILIIDNETNPLSTPGYIYFFNITNVGSESSYIELPEILPVGRYYYFLAQIDGVGHQSTYTMGSFNMVALGSGAPIDNNLLIYIIIGIVLASVVGLIATATIVRKRTKKEVLPQRKKIPLKSIISHLEEISNSLIQDKEFKIVQTQELESEGFSDEQKTDIKINEYKHLGEELFTEGAYLEAQEQFKLGRDLLINLGREDEAKLFSELIAGIEGLIEEREKRLEILEQIKSEGDSAQIFELYQDLIDISKKLRDPDSASFYQSELINYFQNNKLKLVDLEKYRFELDQKAESLFSNNNFKMAAQFYEKCEKITQLLVQLEREEDITKIEGFRNKKNECLKKINNG
jgi:hypothetical protein